MQRMSSPVLARILLSSALRRTLAIVLAVVQLGVTLAPAFHSRDAGDWIAHLEDGGTRLHYTHDETACPSCTATVGGPTPRTEPFLEAPRGKHALPARSTV